MSIEAAGNPELDGQGPTVRKLSAILQGKYFDLGFDMAEAYQLATWHNDNPNKLLEVEFQQQYLALGALRICISHEVNRENERNGGTNHQAVQDTLTGMNAAAIALIHADSQELKDGLRAMKAVRMRNGWRTILNIVDEPTLLADELQAMKTYPGLYDFTNTVKNYAFSFANPTAYVRGTQVVPVGMAVYMRAVQMYEDFPSL